MKTQNAILPWVPVVLLACAFVWLLWEFGILGDWGLESGYYGHLNRVKHVIEDMPNVAIIHEWRHDDVTLEDFGFTLLVDGTREVEVGFWETSAQMEETNKKRLREFIQKEIDSSQRVDNPSPAKTAIAVP